MDKIPDRIYLFKNLISETPDDRWLSERSGDEDIEYVRTDVFIEKVESYIKNQFIKDVAVLTGGHVNINFNIAINNFMNYIKDNNMAK